MDGARFDDLARQLAGRRSRRSVLRGLAGLAAGTLGLGTTKAVEAACPAGQVAASGGRCVCKSTGRPPGATGCPAGPGQTLCNGVGIDLTSDVNNCGACGYVCPQSAELCAGPPVCRANLCLYPPLPAGTVCRPAVDQCDAQEVCDGVSLACPADAKAPTGTVCDDANLCTENDVCNGSGLCVGTAKVCQPLGACYVAGTCDPSSGTCSNPTAAAGTPCGGGPSCTGGAQRGQDTCNGSGLCVPSIPAPCGLYVCGEAACLTSCVDDTQCIGAGHCEGGICVDDGAVGARCDSNGDCANGICNLVSAICCSETCPDGVGCAGPDQTCTPACVPACGGKQCGDDGCGSTCGECGPGQTCNSAGQCVATCTPSCPSGICGEADGCGGKCQTGSCPANQTCSAGQCLGTLPNGAQCAAPGECQSFVCNAVSGACCSQPCPAGVACGGPESTCCGQVGQACCPDGSCAIGAYCDGGTCLTGLPNGTRCTTSGECGSRICDATTGICCSQNCGPDVGCGGANFTCTPPCVPDCTGRTCGGDGCDGTCGTCGPNQTCTAGTCRGTVATGQPCTAPGECQSGFCNATSHICCGQACGANVACDGPGNTCTPTANCGALNQSCCPDDACNQGLECDALGRCGTCGGKTERCCASNTCDGEMVCDTWFTCQDGCGGDGESCCLNNACDPGFGCDVVNGSICVCGAAGQACCADGACDGDLQCTAHGTCGECGELGETCCRGRFSERFTYSCSPPLQCDEFGGFVCKACLPDGDAQAPNTCEGCCSDTCEFWPGYAYFATQVCGTCGDLNEPCCNNQLGAFGDCGPGLVCAQELGACRACGDAGERCCPLCRQDMQGARECRNLSCNAGATCNTGTGFCEPCGDAGEQCCMNCRVVDYRNPDGEFLCTQDRCNAGATCNADSRICELCGTEGLPCCSPDFTCTEAGTQCMGNQGITCQRCGDLNELCCAQLGGSTFCNAGLACNTAYCGECGYEGGFCCDDGSCDGDLVCSAQEACIASCGAEGERCCRFGACDDGLGCDYLQGTLCQPCGDLDEPCCANQTCHAGLRCDESSHGYCKPQFETGRLCDRDTDCQSGFCNAVNNVCCSQDCADGVPCSGGGFTCCGAAIGQACCPDGNCVAGAHCDGGTCIADLANGATCDQDTDCQSGFCDPNRGSTCATHDCGGSGQGCCLSGCPDDCVSHCHDGYYCAAGVDCLPCGYLGQHCCDGGTCHGETGCTSGNVCAPCGDENQACCAGATCHGELNCSSGVCKVCGNNGEQCCTRDLGGGTTFHFCDTDAGVTCAPQPSGPAICVPCGGEGEPCCRTGPSEAELFCNGNLPCHLNEDGNGFICGA